MNYAKKIKDLSNECEVGFLILESPENYSRWARFRLLKGSPLRNLLERQEIWEEEFDRKVKI
jgi:hypothetical protein